MRQEIFSEVNERASKVHDAKGYTDPVSWLEVIRKQANTYESAVFSPSPFEARRELVTLAAYCVRAIESIDTAKEEPPDL